MRRLVVGIDQSLRKTAYCIMDRDTKDIFDFGAILTGNKNTKEYKKKPLDYVEYFNNIHGQCDYIVKNLLNVIKRALEIEDAVLTQVTFEGLSYSSNGNATRDLAFLYGSLRRAIIMMYGFELDAGDFKIDEIPPSRLKSHSREWLPNHVKYLYKADGELLLTTSGSPRLCEMDKKKMMLAVDTVYGPELLKQFTLAKGKDDIADAILICLYYCND